MTKDAVRSAAVARRIRAVEKSCFANCQRAVARDPELANATYVEGFAVVVASRLPFEHAWIEVDGAVIDPTLPDRDLAYFPGLRVSGRDGLAAAKPNPKRRGRYAWEPLFFQYGFGGYEHPGLVAARAEAERLAFGEPLPPTAAVLRQVLSMPD